MFNQIEQIMTDAKGKGIVSNFLYGLLIILFGCFVLLKFLFNFITPSKLKLK
jgi:hypothetical protein